MNIAGIFLVDCRLLSNQEYLLFINQLFLKFAYKYPEAYWTLILFDNNVEYLLNFEKTIQPPRLNLISPTTSATIFDNIAKTIDTTERLMPIYDISKVHFVLASLPKDNGSKQYNVLQARQCIQTKKDQGWRFYFPFSTYESLTSDIAF